MSKLFGSQPPRLSTPQSQPAEQEYRLDREAIRKRYTKYMKGRAYLMVAGRVLLFRGDHPEGRILTELISRTEDGATFKAHVYDSKGNLLATGHGHAILSESSNFGGRIVEKAETAAVGRALALAGYGTDEIDEEDENGEISHLADAPVGR